MSPTEINRIRSDSIVCAADPQPGDCWQEMLCIACLVIDRKGDRVRVCRDKEQTADGKRWQWASSEWMAIVEFQDWLRYSHRRHGFWADFWYRNRADAAAYREAFDAIDAVEVLGILTIYPEEA